MAENVWAHGNKAPGEWHQHGQVDFGEFGDMVVPEAESVAPLI